MLTWRHLLVAWTFALSSVSAAQAPEWMVFNPADMALTAETRFEDVLVDRSNRVWVVYTTGLGKPRWSVQHGLATFHKGRWDIPDIPPALTTLDQISNLTLDTAGNVWIGGFREAYTGLLYKYDGASWQNLGSSYAGAVSLQSDSIGSVWAYMVEPKYPGTSTLIQYTDTSVTVHSEPQLVPFWNIAMGTGRAGIFWIALGAGDSHNPRQTILSSYSGGQWTHYPVTPLGDAPAPLIVDDSGLVWIGSHEFVPDSSGVYQIDNTRGHGLIRFDGMSWTVYDTTNSPIPSNTVTALAIENQRTLWIGTVAGLVRFDGTHWTVYDTSNSGLPNSHVTAITVDQDGNKWVGTVEVEGDASRGHLAIFQEGGIVSVGAERPDGAPGAGISVNTYPNPFSSTTIVEYVLPTAQTVSLRVYDIIGRTVATLAEGRETAGKHTVVFNGGALGAGMYFMGLQVGAQMYVRQIALVN